MTRKLADIVLEEGPDYLKNNTSKIVLCEGDPVNYSNATTANGMGSGVKMAEQAVVPADITIGDGPVDGRQATVKAFTPVTIDTAGTADHVILLDEANTTILGWFQLSTSKLLAASDTVGIPAFSTIFKDAVLAS